ncbi:MAG: tetratricopeptide repeat protein [Pseudomonadota bacterium]
MVSDIRLIAVIALAVLSGCYDHSPPDGYFGPRYNAVTPFDVDEAVDPVETGYKLLAVKDYNNALRAFKRAGTQNVDEAVLVGLGAASHGLGRLGQAEDFLRAAINQNPNSISAWNNLGVVLEDRKRYRAAVNAFRTAFLIPGGDTAVVRQNLFVAQKRIEQIEANEPPFVEPDYILERRGHGRYLLVKNDTKP